MHEEQIADSSAKRARLAFWSRDYYSNADTRTLLDGTKAQTRTEVGRCMSLGCKCPGYFVAVGNHISPDTPVENAICYNQVYEELCWR